MLKNKKSPTREQTLESYLYTSDKARMYALVCDMMDEARHNLERAVEAIEKNDLGLAGRVIQGDEKVDELEERIDQECLYSIAMRQPLREDLRYVYAVMKIVVDIERIGDQAVNLALRLKGYVDEYGGSEPLLKTEIMKQLCQVYSMCADDFLQSLKNEDGGFLQRMQVKHDETVQICNGVADLLMHRLTSPYLTDAPTTIFITVDVFRHLKRVSDHLINLAEKVYFIATGISPKTLKKHPDGASYAEPSNLAEL
ncbi:MAG: phosphate signaling complex PhoU family protein [Pyramidobacter sp.]|jgi:phosphate transport system protein